MRPLPTGMPSSLREAGLSYTKSARAASFWKSTSSRVDVELPPLWAGDEAAERAVAVSPVVRNPRRVCCSALLSTIVLFSGMTCPCFGALRFHGDPCYTAYERRRALPRFTHPLASSAIARGGTCLVLGFDGEQIHIVPGLQGALAFEWVKLLQSHMEMLPRRAAAQLNHLQSHMEMLPRRAAAQLTLGREDSRPLGAAPFV